MKGNILEIGIIIIIPGDFKTRALRAIHVSIFTGLEVVTWEINASLYMKNCIRELGFHIMKWKESFNNSKTFTRNLFKLWNNRLNLNLMRVFNSNSERKQAILLQTIQVTVNNSSNCDQYLLIS
jgi:hypothetical protein